MSDSKNQYLRQRVSSQLEAELEQETPVFQEYKGNINKYNLLTKSEFFDSFGSGYRKQIIQENLQNLAKISKQNEKTLSPMKKENNEIFFSSQVNDNSHLKKENLHFQLKIQELENLKGILEDQLSHKNQQFINNEHKYEKEISRLRDEIDLLRSRNHQIEFDQKSLQEQFIQQKQQKDAEIEQLKLIYQHQQEALLSKEIRELNSKHNNEKVVFQQDLLRMKENMQLYTSQINNQNTQIQQQEEQIKQLRKIEIKSKEQDQSLINKDKEIQRQTEVISKVNQNNENLKYQIRDLEHENSRIQNEYQDTMAIFKQIQYDLEQKINNYQRENEKLQVFPLKCSDQENKINDLNNEINKLNKTIQENRQSYDFLNQNHEKTQNYLQIAEKTIVQLEDTINYINQELERERQNLTLSQDNIQEQKKKYAQLEYEYKELKPVEQRCKDQDLKIQHLYADIQQYKQQQRDLELNLSQKHHVIQSLENQLCNHDKKVMGLEAENQRLVAMVQNKTHDIENLNQDLNHYKQFQLVCKEQEAQLDMLISEIDRLNRLLMEHITDNENQNLKIEDLQRYVQKYREKENEVNLLEIEIQNFMQKTSQMTKMQYTLQDYENKLHSLNQENNHLNNTLNNKQKDLQVSQYKFSEMEQICYQLRQDVGQIQNLSEEIDRLTQVIKERDYELEKQQEQLGQLSVLNKQVQDQLQYFVVLFAEIDSLKKRNDQKDYELEILRKSHMVGYLKR